LRAAAAAACGAGGRELSFDREGFAMRRLFDTARTRRRAGRKPAKTWIGPYAVLFFVVAALITGAIAVSLNLRLEECGGLFHCETSITPRP
jgi:hypothetical protein